jgi:hypothetical protein
MRKVVLGFAVFAVFFCVFWAGYGYGLGGRERSFRKETEKLHSERERIQKEIDMLNDSLDFVLKLRQSIVPHEGSHSSRVIARFEAERKGKVLPLTDNEKKRDSLKFVVFSYRHRLDSLQDLVRRYPMPSSSSGGSAK